MGRNFFKSANARQLIRNMKTGKPRRITQKKKNAQNVDTRLSNHNVSLYPEQTHRNIINPMLENRKNAQNNTTKMETPITKPVPIASNAELSNLRNRYKTTKNINNRIARLNSNIGTTENAVKQGKDDKQNVSFLEGQLEAYKEERSQLEKLKTNNQTKVSSSNTLSKEFDKQYRETQEKPLKNLDALRSNLEQMNKNKAEIEGLRANLSKNQNAESKERKRETLKTKLQLFRGIQSIVLNDSFEEVSEDYPSELLFLLDLEQLVTEKGIVNLTKAAWVAVHQYNRYQNLLDKVKDIPSMLQQVHSRALSKQLVIWKTIKEERIKQKLEKPKSIFGRDTSFYGLLNKEHTRRESEKKSDYTRIYDTMNKNVPKGNEEQEVKMFTQEVLRRFRYIDKLDSDINLRFFGKLIVCLIQKLRNKATPFGSAYNIDQIIRGIKFDDGFKNRVTEGLIYFKEEVKRNVTTMEIKDFENRLFKIIEFITGKHYEEYKDLPVQNGPVISSQSAFEQLARKA